MCLTVVGKIVEKTGKKGVAEVNGELRELNLELVKVKKGDFVSCALNLAVEKLDEEEAKTILEARNGLAK